MDMECKETDKVTIEEARKQQGHEQARSIGMVRDTI